MRQETKETLTSGQEFAAACQDFAQWMTTVTPEMIDTLRDEEMAQVNTNMAQCRQLMMQCMTIVSRTGGTPQPA